MKKILSLVLLTTFFIGNATMKANDLLPSEAYYKENIAVNEVAASAPSLRAQGDPFVPNPPSGGVQGGGGQVNAPIGDAFFPLLVASVLYGSFLLYRKRRTVN